MTQTVDKDFKVKNGLQVAGGATFGGPVTGVTPTNPNHLATKQYVDSVSGGGSGSNIIVGPLEPELPVNGSQWFDTSTTRLKIYYAGQWYTLATSDDALNLIDHTHDPVTGLVDNTFIYGGQPSDINMPIIDGGSPSTTFWQIVFDGGLVEQLFDSGDPNNQSLVFADGGVPETQTWQSLLDGNGV